MEFNLISKNKRFCNHNRENKLRAQMAKKFKKLQGWTRTDLRNFQIQKNTKCLVGKSKVVFTVFLQLSSEKSRNF